MKNNKKNTNNLTKRLFDITISSLTADNFSDIVENCRADIRPMVKGLDESGISELSMMIAALQFLTSKEMKGHEKHNVLVLKDYLKKNTDLTLDEIEVFIKPSFLRYAILEMVKKDNRLANERN